jgi:hypothetical protein
MNKSRKNTKKRLHKGKKIEAKKPLITVQLTDILIISGHDLSSGGGTIPPPPPSQINAA